MKISYDSEADVLYIRLLEGKHECSTLRLSEEVALDFGEGEKLVGVEILDAREVLGTGKTPLIFLEGLMASTEPMAVHEKPPEEYKA